MEDYKKRRWVVGKDGWFHQKGDSWSISDILREKKDEVVLILLSPPGIGIDPKVEKLLPLSFIKEEAVRHGLKGVFIDESLWTERGQPGIYYEGRIFLDPTAPMADVLKRLNSDNAHSLEIRAEEAYYFIFWHEAAHVDEEKSEWDCNYYARRRLIEFRDEKEKQRKTLLTAEVMRSRLRRSSDQGPWLHGRM